VIAENAVNAAIGKRRTPPPRPRGQTPSEERNTCWRHLPISDRFRLYAAASKTGENMGICDPELFAESASTEILWLPSVWGF
jgi:hypothetical protein